MSRLDGKIAVVTGGSRGIRKAICLKLAEHGANVSFAYATNKEKDDSTVKELSNFNNDVSNESEVKNLVNKIIGKYGKIDILVNNAGITLVGTFNMVHHCYMNFIKNNCGKIINISSVVGLNRKI